MDQISPYLLCSRDSVNQDELESRRRLGLVQNPLAAARALGTSAESRSIPSNSSIKSCKICHHQSSSRYDTHAELSTSVPASQSKTSSPIALMSGSYSYACSKETDFGQRGNWSVSLASKLSTYLSCSMAAILTKALSRECRGHEGRMWICPHEMWDYAQVRDFRTGSKFRKHLQWIWLYGLCKCGNHVVWLGPDRVYQWRSLLTILAWVKALKSIVIHALNWFDVHICPRIKMSDAVVLEAFPDDLEVRLGFCYCEKCNMLESQISKCTICD